MKTLNIRWRRQQRRWQEEGWQEALARQHHLAPRLGVGGERGVRHRAPDRQDGGDVPGREGEKVPAGTVLYKVLWEGFPPEIATWEEEDQIPCGEVDFVEQYEASLAEEEAEEEAQAEESESDGE